VKTASLHAGTQCCLNIPDLHFRAPGVPFQQGAPTFSEDIVIPWEGKRLLDVVRRAAPKIVAGQDVRLTARVSEGPSNAANSKRNSATSSPKRARMPSVSTSSC